MTFALVESYETAALKLSGMSKAEVESSSNIRPGCRLCCQVNDKGRVVFCDAGS